MQLPLVSIVIPCRNEERHIRECIDAIIYSDYPKESIEIIVVDGMSTDSTMEILITEYSNGQRDYPVFKIVSNPKLMTPVSMNIGIEIAQGKYIVIVGVRNIMSKDYIRECVHVLSNNTDIACVGGLVDNYCENEKSKGIAKSMQSKIGVGFNNFRSKKESGYVDTVAMPCFRKTLFDEIGLFDEELVRNQDDEISYRIIKSGYKIFLDANISIKYYVRANFKNLFSQYFQYGYWKVYVNRKHKTITTLRQIVPSIFISYLALSFLLLFIPGYPLLFFFSLLFYFFIILTISIISTKSLITGFYMNYAIYNLHFGYGFGYLKGIFDFFILNKKPSDKHKKLTR